jgi:hypothetical protein
VRYQQIAETRRIEEKIVPQPVEQEQPWTPCTPDQIPFDITLTSPDGTRHLAFDNQTGRWHRLWQHRTPQALHTGEAVFLRPGDVDQIVVVSNIWSIRHRDHPRSSALVNELADGVKQLVMHLAGLTQDQ